MTSFTSLIAALDERNIAGAVGLMHDEARMCFPLQSNTVSSFDEFSAVIGAYYNHHFSMAVSHGGRLNPGEAVGRAKELLEREYRRRNGDVVTAFNDANDGTNGGMRRVLDVLAEGIKAECIERYIRDAFDRHVTPNAWEQKVEIIRQFIQQSGPFLASSIQRHQPERYAQNYEELIRSYVKALQETSSVFRRL
ncbi:MAG: hypothetical protein GC154_16870 [bacterium]|nr:hypothetical protein [bacterium]